MTPAALNACVLATPTAMESRLYKTFVSAAVWPADRLRELNGEAQGDDEEEPAVVRYRPWEIVCVVHNFADWEAAEEFAAAWKQPYSNPLTKERVRGLLEEHGIGTGYSVTRRLRELFAMLHWPPWNDWDLTISFTSDVSYDKAFALTGFNTCRADLRPLDSFPLKANADSSTLATLNNTWRRCIHLTREQKLTLAYCAREYPIEMQAQLVEWAKDQFDLTIVRTEPGGYDTLRRQQQLESTAGEELGNKRQRTVQHQGIHYVGGDAVDMKTEPVELPLSRPLPVVEPAVDDAHAVKRLIQLAIEMRCDPSITLELNRMLEKRIASGSNSNIPRASLAEAATPAAQPAVVSPGFTLRAVRSPP